MINKRMQAEIALLKSRSYEVTHNEDCSWIYIKNFPIPPNIGWNRDKTDVCIQILPTYPGAQPYGFYVPAGIMCNGNVPKNFQPKANNTPPFDGEWGFFSMKVDNWMATDDLIKGSNLYNHLITFKERLKEGV